MTLADMLENRFRGDVRYRGAAYLRAERVSITRVTPDEVFGIVRDGVEYQTHVSRKNDELKMYCNCAATGQPETVCKHLWGTILAIDEGGYISASLKPGYVPPFVATEQEGFTFDEEWEDDGADVVLRSSIAQQVARKRAAMPQQLQQWEERLRTCGPTYRPASLQSPPRDGSARSSTKSTRS